MSSGDFDAFKSEDGGGGEPPLGRHTATLVHTAVIDTKNGWKVKLEWQSTDLAYYWESWHGVAGGQRRFTQKMLTELGVDYQKLNGWDELGDELAQAEDGIFVVNVKRNGDFLNTDVVGKPDGVQTELPVVAPATPPASRNAIFDDYDSVPF